MLMVIPQLNATLAALEADLEDLDESVKCVLLFDPLSPWSGS